MKKMIVLLVFSCIAGIVFAQEAKEAVKEPASKEIAAIRTANNLAKYGYENYAPSALIEAARILLQTPTQPLKPVSMEKGESVGKEETKSEKREFDPMILLSDAKRFAGEDVALLALAAQVEKMNADTESRGRVGGPGKTVTSVSAGATDSYVVTFWAGSLAEILVSGDGDTDLDLYVYDENGNLIEADQDYSDDCYVSWVPKWTGGYVVKVVNRGGVYNRYVMVTN